MNAAGLAERVFSLMSKAIRECPKFDSQHSGVSKMSYALRTSKCAG